LTSPDNTLGGTIPPGRAFINPDRQIESMFLSPFESEAVFKIVFSVCLGLLIGFERQVHGKPAGMRTLSLVAMGSTLFTIVSYGLGGFADPTRIASGIVTGIGFLGAGTIFKSEKHVQGITTAAELWMMAAVGIAVGIGMFMTSFIATIIVLIIIIGGRAFENKTEDLFREHRRTHGEEKF
jgi:putative Mg2+ transporter-C (MgtC) family protein